MPLNCASILIIFMIIQLRCVNDKQPVSCNFRLVTMHTNLYVAMQGILTDG